MGGLEPGLAAQAMGAQAEETLETMRERARDAFLALRVAEEKERDWAQELGQARRLLVDPSAADAARALTVITAAAANCMDALSTLMAAERAARDVLVLQRCAETDPGDREAFIAAAEDACGGPLDLHQRSALLLAHQKIAGHLPGSFQSQRRQHAQDLRDLSQLGLRRWPRPPLTVPSDTGAVGR